MQVGGHRREGGRGRLDRDIDRGRREAIGALEKMSIRGGGQDQLRLALSGLSPARSSSNKSSLRRSSSGPQKVDRGTTDPEAG